MKSAERDSLLKMSSSTYSTLMPSYSATARTAAVRGLPAAMQEEHNAHEHSH